MTRRSFAYVPMLSPAAAGKMWDQKVKKLETAVSNGRGREYDFLHASTDILGQTLVHYAHGYADAKVRGDAEQRKLMGLYMKVTLQSLCKRQDADSASPRMKSIADALGGLTPQQLNNAAALTKALKHLPASSSAAKPVRLTEQEMRISLWCTCPLARDFNPFTPS